MLTVVGLVIAATLLYAGRGFLKINRAGADYAQYRADRIAQQLGFTLAEGDPGWNLALAVANPDMRNNKPVDMKIRLTGTHQGVPVELLYTCRAEISGVVNRVKKEWWSCRMTAFARQPFPPFEVATCQMPHGAVERTQPLPPVNTGRPDIDATYVVATQEPAMAQVLGEMLPGFAPFGQSGVHLVGDGTGVSFVMEKEGWPLVMLALDQAPVMKEQLAVLAQRVGG
ncbi:hypothetical protein ACFU9X_32970 [Streptomyces atratus]|uniref:hypothetical protein n=1 Tax=Streptomyces atratus TaxID=1893 RepID=UPI00367C8CB5